MLPSPKEFLQQCFCDKVIHFHNNSIAQYFSFHFLRIIFLVIPTYIGGSSLIVDTNDGKRGKNIHSFKMGLEAIEDIPASQKKIIKIGPLNRNSMRVIRELTLDSVDGLMFLDNSDDNRWYRFIQNDSYRSPKNTQYEDVNVEKLVESLILLKADYERQIDDLKNTIRELKKGEL